MSTLRALLISDGKPGHYHLAEGIVAAIGRRRSVDIHRLPVRRPRWLTPGVLWRLSSSGLSPALILGYAYGVDATLVPASDIVVSAGGDTLAANIAAARLLAVPNVFYGSLRRYEPESFALVLTSYQRNASKPRHAMTLKPSPMDPDRLPAPTHVSSRPPAVAGLLVGGDAGTVTFTAKDWSGLLDFLDASHSALGTRWIVSNSPRTPHSFSDALAARRAAEPSGPIVEYIDFRSAGPGTLDGLFARAETIAVTADSSSMVSEAVWARRPVIAVAPEAMTLPPDEQAYRQYLETNGWAASLPIADLTPEMFVSAARRIKPLDENPLDRLADLLADKLPSLGLSQS